tara:strand:+ start:96 stop:737 length:642 start_codon:yes stop_codon:yes gene_type:complete
MSLLIKILKRTPFYTFSFLFLPFLLIYLPYYGNRNSIDSNVFFRDISAQFDIPIYAGFFSSLGIFIIIATFTICIFTKKLLHKNRHKNKVKISFYNYASILNFIIFLDDKFLLHESMPSDLYFYIFYMVFVTLLMQKLRGLIIKKEFKYFIFSLLFFFGSCFLDLGIFKSSVFNPIGGMGVLEDIFKFMGYYLWLIFFANLSIRIISEEEFRI